MNADVSSELGQLLLKGWIMSAESCTSCLIPLMQNPRDNKLHCVSCGGKTGIEDEQKMQEDNDTSPTSIPEDLAADISALSPTNHQQIINDASAALSQKMLQGYTLLSQNCPKCHIPLVKKKNDINMLCVCCQETIDSSTENQKKRSLTSSDATQTSTKQTRQPTQGWIDATYQALTWKLMGLTRDLQTKLEGKDTVIEINNCLDGLLKLKQFQD